MMVWDRNPQQEQMYFHDHHELLKSHLLYCEIIPSLTMGYRAATVNVPEKIKLFGLFIFAV